MRHPPRKIVSIVAVIVAALMVTACSGGTASPSASSPAATASAPATQSTAPAEPTVVRFWQLRFEDYQQEFFEAQVKAFNDSQDIIDVQHTVVPGDAWDAKLKTAQAAGTAPDVVTTAYGAIKPGVRNGQFAALDDLIEAAAFDDLESNVQEFIRTDDSYFAYPLLVEPSTVLFYRKDLFTAAGLDPNSPPKTWDELVEAARALTKDGVYGMNIAQTAVDIGWSSWGLQWNAAGHLPISDDWSEPAVSDDGYRQLIDLYRTLYTEKLMPQEPTFGYADCTPFGQGTVAMTACGSWAIGLFNTDFADLLPNIGVAAFPSADGDTTKPTATLGGWTLTVDAKSKAPQQAADFISWLAAGDPQIMVEFFKATGGSKYSPRQSVVAAIGADPEASSNTFLQVVSSDVVPYAKPEPAYPFDVSLAFGTAVEKVMKGGDVDAALAEAEAAIADVIEKQKLAGTGG